MGQWYNISNLTKGERIDGAKLMEFSYLGNSAIQQLEHLLQTDWKGDQVAVCGDYLDLDELAEHPALLAADEQAPLRFDENGDWITPIFREYEDVTDSEVPAAPPVHFILNHQRKEYLDQWKVPIEYIWEGEGDIGTLAISPLSLLLAANNHSGGSYDGIRKSVVGRWCGESPFLELTDTLDGIDDDWNELRPDFTEDRGEKECFSETALSDFVTKVKQLYVNGKITLAEAEKLKVDPHCTHLLTTRQLRKELRGWIETERESAASRPAGKGSAGKASPSRASGLAGKNFVITGKVAHFANRNEAGDWIYQHGGSLQRSVSASTSYLVTNNPASNSVKTKKARELGIPIISEADMLAMA